MEIAKKSQETTTNPYFDTVISHAKFKWSQNRDLWFTLPPQQSFLVSWLFSVIPIPCLKFLFFYYSTIVQFTYSVS